MTAEEVLRKNKHQLTTVGSMKEYARIKCQELLLLVAEEAYAQVEYDCAVIDKDSILNAVDLDKFIV